MIDGNNKDELSEDLEEEVNDTNSPQVNQSQ